MTHLDYMIYTNYILQIAEMTVNTDLQYIYGDIAILCFNRLLTSCNIYGSILHREKGQWRSRDLIKNRPGIGS